MIIMAVGAKEDGRIYIAEISYHGDGTPEAS
jgi:hypothetical protein